MDLAEEVVISSLCVAIITLMHYLFMYVTYMLLAKQSVAQVVKVYGTGIRFSTDCIVPTFHASLLIVTGMQI